jgi:hypothetical protein
MLMLSIRVSYSLTLLAELQAGAGGLKGPIGVAMVHVNPLIESAKHPARGGMVGLQFGNSMNNPRYFDWLQKNKVAHPAAPVSKPTDALNEIAAIHAAVAREYPPEAHGMPEDLRMPVDQMVWVLDHWIELAGEDHVSLGSDLDGWPALAKGMNDISDYPLLIAAMREHGYSDQRIQKIAGLNLLRIIRQITEGNHPASWRRLHPCTGWRLDEQRQLSGKPRFVGQWAPAGAISITLIPFGARVSVRSTVPVTVPILSAPFGERFLSS